MNSFRDRMDGEEILDHGTADEREVAESLEDLRRLNRYLGGWRGLSRTLLPNLVAASTNGSADLLDGSATAPQGSTSPSLRILDVGTGGADLPSWLEAWSSRRSLDVRIFGVDRQRVHLRCARKRQANGRRLHLVQADAEALPFRPGSFDYVYSNLFLHHFSPEQATRQLAALARLARRALFVFDLVRHPAPYYFLKLAGRLFTRSAITRHDGLVSIRRAYRPNELRELGRRAGLRDFRVETYFPWRQVLIANVNGGSSRVSAESGERARRL